MGSGPILVSSDEVSHDAYFLKVISHPDKKPLGFRSGFDINKVVFLPMIIGVQFVIEFRSAMETLTMVLVVSAEVIRHPRGNL